LRAVRQRAAAVAALNSRFSSRRTPPCARAGETKWKPNASTPSPIPSKTWSGAPASCGGIFDFEAKRGRLAELIKLAEDPALWSDSKRAQEVGRERKALESVVGALEGVAQGLRDNRELLELALAESDDATLEAVAAEVGGLEKTVADLEFRRMFSNPMDPNNCFLDIQSGQGGTEAQDWAAMLERMYVRFCERRGFEVEVLEESPGEVAGLKSAALKVSGPYAYGTLRTETGIHRLVRKSPFDANARRHTSFASVFVYPEVDESIEIEINPADVRVDTFRASGAGGQHVNKTDSAIRMTHIPSGIVVQCQNDRSQHRNRAEAWAMLKARLYEAELRKREAEKQKIEESKTDIGWGHQIRNYILDQSIIKDLRTNVEVGNTRGVLDGDLDQFITASLKQGV
jgi:peptide chain release factor 2